MAWIHGGQRRYVAKWDADMCGEALSWSMKRALKFARKSGNIAYPGCAAGVTKATLKALHRRGLMVVEVITTSEIKWTRFGNTGTRWYTDYTATLNEAGEKAAKDL